MNKFSVLEPIIRDIKKLAGNLLMPNSPLDRIVTVCNRLLVLKSSADWDKAINEMHAKFDALQECMIKLNKLLSSINKIGKA